MAGLGYPRERRAFHPHLTLGRIRSTNRIGVLTDMVEKSIFTSDIFVVSRICLMQSRLQPAGSVYETKKVFPLIGNFPIRA
jgi:2'-5' RNA ligase